jgi:hypothetical protein
MVDAGINLPPVGVVFFLEELLRLGTGTRALAAARMATLTARAFGMPVSVPIFARFQRG